MVLRRIVIALGLLLGTLGLAACGGDDTVGGGSDAEVKTAESGPVEGKLTISNWPGYIDPGKNGSVAEFEDATGVTVKYIEDVNSNTTFFGKMQPLLDQGESGGRDIFVVTDWMAAQMYNLGYLQEYNPDDIDTALENLAPQFESEGQYDPEHKFSIPWQGGMTGIWVNTSEADEITSINDLFDPKYKGRVTMLDEMRDTVPLVMRADGIATADATKEDWLAAIDKLEKAVDSGQIRRFTGNEYTEDLTSGNAVASIGWSGDAYLIGRDDVEWRRPDEGCNLWFDMAVIPAGAPNPPAALEFLNFAYEPEVQADIAEFVNYVTPVAGVREILAKRDPKLAENPLIFPDEEFTADCEPFTEPPGEDADVQEVTEAFQEIVSG
ncbi:MAG: spermidine/putrescine ABC transporter substrate-binding protein [Actinomycetota bacterium]|nr:spermidine/putrescine ABC transporter substrate-binding protein [Actinomycetota bacterium]